MTILLANPRGFCAGVDRAITIVERALALHGAPIYVRHEIVHNKFVVDQLRQQGAIFIEALDEVPDGCTVVFSAHGVPQAVRQHAQQKKLRIFDATCPLVNKVHMEVQRLRQANKEVILIGHAGHPEVEGTLGQSPGGMYLVSSVEQAQRLIINDPQHIAYVTQTTLSVDDSRQIIDALTQRFPAISGPKTDDICYATQNRQDAVKALARQCDLILIIGSHNSSNSNRLREVATQTGVDAHLINDITELEESWLQNKACIGISAGASAPEILVQQLVEHLQLSQPRQVIQQISGIEEHTAFPLPAALK